MYCENHDYEYPDNQPEIGVFSFCPYCELLRLNDKLTIVESSYKNCSEGFNKCADQLSAANKEIERLKKERDDIEKQAASAWDVFNEALAVKRKVAAMMAGYISGTTGWTDKHPQEVLDYFRKQAQKEK